MHRNKQIFKTNFSLNIIQNNLLYIYVQEKKFQKFNYFYDFFYTNLVGSSNKASINIF